MPVAGPASGIRDRCRNPRSTGIPALAACNGCQPSGVAVSCVEGLGVGRNQTASGRPDPDGSGSSISQATLQDRYDEGSGAALTQGVTLRQLTAPVRTVTTARRWTMLGASTLAQAAAAVMMHGPAFLIPTLHEQEGMSLAQAGLVAAAPTIGVMLTLVAWGWVTDRRGERFVLLTGLRHHGRGRRRRALRRPGPAGRHALPRRRGRRQHQRRQRPRRRRLVPARAPRPGDGDPPDVAAGRGRRRRHLDRGRRRRARRARRALGADDRLRARRAAGRRRGHRPAATRAREGAAATNPYRQDSYLARIHGVSVLLVVPQFLVWSFALVWLVQDRDWSPAAAGTVVAIAQVVGALGRIAVGHLSDVVGGRMRPLRWVASPPPPRWRCSA